MTKPKIVILILLAWIVPFVFDSFFTSNYYLIQAFISLLIPLFIGIKIRKYGLKKNSILLFIYCALILLTGLMTV